jgi:hypothetical protein
MSQSVIIPFGLISKIIMQNPQNPKESNRRRGGLSDSFREKLSGGVILGVRSARKRRNNGRERAWLIWLKIEEIANLRIYLTE